MKATSYIFALTYGVMAVLAAATPALEERNLDRRGACPGQTTCSCSVSFTEFLSDGEPVTTFTVSDGAVPANQDGQISRTMSNGLQTCGISMNRTCQCSSWSINTGNCGAAERVSFRCS